MHISQKSSTFVANSQKTYTMKRIFSVLIVLSLVILPLTGSRFEPAPRDDGMFRNFFYNEKQRQIFYHVAKPEGVTVYRCANARSKTIVTLPYGALLSVHWSDPHGWTYVSCPDYAHSVTYNGYVPSTAIRKIDKVQISNPKGARAEEVIDGFRNRKAKEILPQGKQFEVSQEATNWGYIKIKHRMQNYRDVAIVRMSDVKPVLTSPIALKSKGLPTYIVREKRTAPLLFPVEKKIGTEYVITGFDTIGYLQPGTQMMLRKKQIESAKSLITIETLNMDTIAVGMVPKTALKMEDGTMIKRWIWNAQSGIANFSLSSPKSSKPTPSRELVSEKVKEEHFNFLSNLRIYFDKKTNNPKVSNWEKYKWHMWGILIWALIAYVLLIVISNYPGGVVDTLYFCWFFIPPYIYLKTNPHSLWFSDPACVGWTWAFVGLLFFIALSAWFWTNFKRFGLRFNGTNWFTKLLGIAFGWGCGYIMVLVLLATFDQDLALLSLAVLFSWFGRVPTPSSQSTDGQLIDEHGHVIDGHFDSGDPNRFFGNDGRTYEKDFGDGNFHPV